MRNSRKGTKTQRTFLFYHRKHRDKKEDFVVLKTLNPPQTQKYLTQKHGDHKENLLHTAPTQTYNHLD
jgi:hypothetical protein